VTYELGVPRIDDVLEGVDAGTNLLVTGSSVTDRDTFVRDCVSTGLDAGEGVVYVTTNGSGPEIVDRYADHDLSRFAVVDCVSENRSLGEREESEIIRETGSPSDMTGIGIEVSDVLEGFWEVRGIERNRVFLDSVSTLLMYSDLETVFRFLHVFTGRIRSVGGLGLFVIDPGMHDQKDLSTLRQLFDGTVRVGDDGDISVEGLEEVQGGLE